ncbi:hypothetical protein BCR34DRAFT_664684 [Clohesyomyces aquaticus]|uniref:Uncharacterized protein n=1 Tax=Clohesyomyces aquaticus TaxID=1231657 RepID=A0A1Y1ZL60_9PLEO|nr:hypothetical protein BCR34DRAFT_664684 [Clohesyomyces aquaticus]
MIFSTHNVAFVFSILILAPTAVGSGLSRCTKWSVRFGWLVGTCLNDENPPVQVESSLLLNQIVAVNNQSQFVWSTRSESYNGPNHPRPMYNPLHVSPQTPPNNPLTATYINNYNGFLLQNFTKTIYVPTWKSTVPVPTFFQLGFYLERSNCSSPFEPLDYYAPVQCKKVDNSNDTGIEHRGWSMAINDGYHLFLFGRDDCHGPQLALLGMEDNRKFCQALSGRVNSYAIRPLWHADYDIDLADGKPFHRGELCAPEQNFAILASDSSDPRTKPIPELEGTIERSEKCRDYTFERLML